MTSLSAEAIRHYHEHGYYSPVRALSAAEAAELRRHLEEYERAGGTLSGPLRHKTHLLFTWLNDLIRRPSILDAVEDIIGPNILCWGTSFFIKEAANHDLVVMGASAQPTNASPDGRYLFGTLAESVATVPATTRWPTPSTRAPPYFARSHVATASRAARPSHTQSSKLFCARTLP